MRMFRLRKRSQQHILRVVRETREFRKCQSIAIDFSCIFRMEWKIFIECWLVLWNSVGWKFSGKSSNGCVNSIIPQMVMLVMVVDCENNEYQIIGNSLSASSSSSCPHWSIYRGLNVGISLYKGTQIMLLWPLFLYVSCDGIKPCLQCRSDI